MGNMTPLEWCHKSAMASHYDDVIMSAIPSQITSLTIVYSTVYSGVDQRKHQSSASLAFVLGIYRDRWIPRTKGQLRGKCFHLMTSPWQIRKSTVWSMVCPFGIIAKTKKIIARRTQRVSNAESVSCRAIIMIKDVKMPRRISTRFWFTLLL